jgi:plastocyanin
MVRATLAIATATAVALSIVGAALSRANTTTPTLAGTVGPSFSITLKKSGKLVKTLKAGTYKFVINDKSNFHGYSLDGPHGFAKDFTKISFVGRKTFIVKLKTGKYKYYCPNHESTMFAHFTVK